MMLLALALFTVLQLDPSVDGNIAETVKCGQWERIDENHWRAENGADVLFDSGKWHHFRDAVDATEAAAPDLTDTLEAFCHVEIYDGDDVQP